MKFLRCLRNLWACLSEAWRWLRTDERELEAVTDRFGIY